MEGSYSKLNSLSSVVKEYFRLRTDEFKKNVIASLAVGFSRVLSVLVILMLLMVVLAVFSVGFIIFFGDIIGSWSGAAFIIGGIYLIALVILYLMRKRLFLGMFIDLFTSITVTGRSDYGLKSLALLIIRYLRDQEIMSDDFK